MSRTALSYSADWKTAVDEVATEFGGDAAWLLAFVTDDHFEHLEALAAALAKKTGATKCIVCSALGVLTEAGEVEGAPGLAVLALGKDEAWPTVAVPAQSEPEGVVLGRNLGLQLGDMSLSVLLASPDAAWPEDLQGGLLEALEDEVPVFGAGLAGGNQGGVAKIVVDGEVLPAPALALGVAADAFDHALSVAWSPRGKVHDITAVQGKKITELDGRPAIEVLAEDVGEEFASRAGGGDGAVLFGLPVDPATEDLAQGHFLVRNLVGIHPRSKALITASPPRPDDRVGFVVRDIEAARAHLDLVVGELAARWQGPPPRYGIVFDCCARGQDFYGRSNVDVEVVRNHFPELPVLGIFGSFELAPVGDQQPLHAYTGVLLLIR